MTIKADVSVKHVPWRAQRAHKWLVSLFIHHVSMQDWEEGDGDYLAPELLSDDKPTPAADMYSLGATIYECATGESNLHMQSSSNHKKAPLVPVCG